MRSFKEWWADNYTNDYYSGFRTFLRFPPFWFQIAVVVPSVIAFWMLMVRLGYSN